MIGIECSLDDFKCFTISCVAVDIQWMLILQLKI